MLLPVSNKMKYLVVIFGLLAVMACSQLTKQVSNNAATELAAVIAEHSDHYRQMSPFNQPLVGDTNAYLPDLSPATLAAQQQRTGQIYRQLMAITADDLSLQDKINWSVLGYLLKNQIDSYNNKEHYMPLTAESGFHASISWMHRRVNFTEQQDYIDYLARLQALPQYFDQQMYWMEQGIKEGITQPAEVLVGFEQSIQAFITDDATKSEYYRPFNNIVKHIPEAQQHALRNQARLFIEQFVVPSYQKYYDFMVDR